MSGLRWRCRRCGWMKAKDFMVRHSLSGQPTTLCLACEAHDQIKQDEYAQARVASGSIPLPRP